VRWLANTYAELSEGQRWTIALVVLLTVVFIAFGLRGESVPPTAAAAPLTPQSAAVTPQSTIAPVGDTAGGLQPLALGASIDGSLPSYSSSEPAGGASPIVGTAPNEPTTPPGSPSTTCPVSIPSTGTPFDTVTTLFESLCITIEQAPGSQGAAPTAGQGSASLPGPEVPATPGVSTGTPTVAEPGTWATVDEIVGASNSSASSDRLRLSVTVGLLQGGSVPARLATTLSALRKSGVEVHLLLVPDLAGDGTPAAFGPWARSVAAALPAAQTLAVVLGAVPPADAPGLPSDVVSAVTAVRTAPVGIWWADGGLLPADQPVWTALGRDLTSAGPLPAFVGTTLPGSSQCALVNAGRAEAARVPSLAAAPVVVEALNPSAPSPGRCTSTPWTVTWRGPA